MPRSAIRWVTGVLDLGVGILQGAPPARWGPLCLFDTRHSSFGVLSQHPRRIVSELSFSHRREPAPVNQQHQCTMPAIWEAVSSQRLLATGTRAAMPVSRPAPATRPSIPVAQPAPAPIERSQPVSRPESSGAFIGIQSSSDTRTYSNRGQQSMQSVPRSAPVSRPAPSGGGGGGGGGHVSGGSYGGGGGHGGEVRH